jgi:hypothetical protein
MRRVVAALPADYADSVFVNCPFDAKYKPLLHATLFTIHDCGFTAKHALQDVGGRESRLDKITRLIDHSRLSIHDVSRVQLSRGSRLPRFNMPFECGLAFGAMRYGDGDGRDALVMTGARDQDKAALSDLAGIDPGYHDNDPVKVIASVRKFLAAKASALGAPKRPMRVHTKIARRLEAFKSKLPQQIREHGSRLSLRELNSFDYINDWLNFAVLWIVANND